jgi:hypothetical protein
MTVVVRYRPRAAVLYALNRLDPQQAGRRRERLLRQRLDEAVDIFQHRLSWKR